MPNNDYFSFQRLAEDIAALRRPESFKRMPVLPLLMALLHPLFGGPQPYLSAAIAVNIACSLGLLYVVYRVALHIVPRATALVVLLLAGASQFQVMARQPLVEPALGFWIAMTVWLRLRRQPAAWISLGLAALCRVEALILIPIFLAEHWLPPSARAGESRAADGDPTPLALPTAPGASITAAGAQPGLASSRGRGASDLRRDLVAATAAALPGLLWTQGDGSGGYLALMEAMHFQPNWDFPLLAVEQALGGWWDAPLAWLWLFGAPTTLLGLTALWRRSPRSAWLLAASYLALTAVVTAFGIAKTRYAYAGQWLPFLAFAQGLVTVADSLSGGLRSRERLARGLALAAALLLVLPLLTGSLRRQRDEQHWIRYYAYEAHLLGAWMQQRSAEVSGIVSLVPSQLRFMLPQVPTERIKGFEELVADGADPGALAAEMRRRGLSHVAYTYRARPETADQRYYWREINGDMAVLFESGAPVAGFRHVATLPIDPALQKADVQVYRLDPP